MNYSKQKPRQQKRNSKTLRDIKEVEVNYFYDSENSERRIDEVVDVLIEILFPNKSR